MPEIIQTSPDFKPIVRIFDRYKALKLTFTADKLVDVDFNQDLVGGDKEFSFEIDGPPQVPIEIGDYALIQRRPDENPLFVGEILRTPISNGLHLGQASFPITVIDELNYSGSAAMIAAGWTVTGSGMNVQHYISNTAQETPNYNCPDRLFVPGYLNGMYSTQNWGPNDEGRLIYRPPTPLDITDKSLVIWVKIRNYEGQTLDYDRVDWDIYSDTGGPNEAFMRSNKLSVFQDFFNGDFDSESWYQWRMDFSFGNYSEVEPLFDPTNVDFMRWRILKDSGSFTNFTFVFQKFIMFEPRPIYPNGRAEYFANTRFKYSGLGFYGRLAYWLRDEELEFTSDYILRDIWGEGFMDHTPFIDHWYRTQDMPDYEMRVDRSTVQEMSNEAAIHAGHHILRISQRTGDAYKDTPTVSAGIFAKGYEPTHFLQEGVHFNFRDGAVDGSGLVNYISLRTGLVDYKGTSQASNQKVSQELFYSQQIYGERRVVGQSPQNVAEDITLVDRRAFVDARDRGFPVIELSISDINYTPIIRPGEIVQLRTRQGASFNVRIRSINYRFSDSGFKIRLTLGEAHRANPGRTQLYALTSKAHKGVDMMSANITQT